MTVSMLVVSCSGCAAGSMDCATTIDGVVADAVGVVVTRVPTTTTRCPLRASIPPAARIASSVSTSWVGSARVICQYIALERLTREPGLRVCI